MDVHALGRDLESGIEGEVRFDEVSRALYSTDASVYQIEPAGVVSVKSRDDVIHVVKTCRQHGCSLTMRGGGTSQAGQAIGAGVQVDTSKYFNRLRPVNAAGRWARVEPGTMRPSYMATREEAHSTRGRANVLRPAMAGRLDESGLGDAGVNDVMALCPTAALLPLADRGHRIVFLEPGCCGMAGSFGYMREHFDVSRAIGERKLLPAARARKADSVLVASGVSCRHQVRDLANARALHPAALLLDLTQRVSLESA